MGHSRAENHSGDGAEALRRAPMSGLILEGALSAKVLSKSMRGLYASFYLISNGIKLQEVIKEPILYRFFDKILVELRI